MAFAYARRHFVPHGYAPFALGFALGEEAHQWVSQGESGVGTLLQYAQAPSSRCQLGRIGEVGAAFLARH